MKRLRLLVDIEVAPILPEAHVAGRVRDILHEYMLPKTSRPPRVTIIGNGKSVQQLQLEFNEDVE